MEIKKLGLIDLRPLDPEVIRKLSVVEVKIPEPYDRDGLPIENGPMDPRMGVIDPGLRCKTCGGKYGECLGHFGRIELARPVYHVKFLNEIKRLLQYTCPKCGRAIIPQKLKEQFLKKINEYINEGKYDELSNFIQSTVIPKINEYRKKHKKCPYCNAELKEIKFEKPWYFYIKEKIGDKEEWVKLTPLDVRQWLEKIPDEDAKLFGIINGRPEWLVLTVILVPPVTARPSIILETGERSEDDLTHKIADIVRINNRIEELLSYGAPEPILEENWEMLQYHVATYFDNELPNVPKARHRSGRPLKGLLQRIKGKEGRLRRNLAGKRVNFSARGVISVDPRIDIDEVGVPEQVAKELTFPEIVTEWNLDWLKQKVLNGPESLDGANYVIDPNGRRFKIMEENKEELAERLEPGWVVERHIINGDYALFNRQPSLHKMSMMGHRSVILPGKTFRLNPATTTPYNADFDGDEMNYHLVQNYEGKTEIEFLANVREHIVTPRYGLAIIGATEDIITGLYLLSLKDKIPFKDAIQLIEYNCKYFGKDKILKLVEKAKKEGRDYLTGKEVFSALLPDDLDFEIKTKNGEFVIKNGILLKGVIDKEIVGVEKGKLIRELFERYGPEFTFKWLSDVTRLSVNYLTREQLTISFSDIDIPKEVKEQIRKIIEKAKKEVDNLIERYKKGEIKPLPGRTIEETLEIEILKVLNKARDEVGEVIEKHVDPTKGTMILAKSGARGKLLNLIQVVGLVGQQSISGRRMEEGYKDRVLPHFKKGDKSAKARGFVEHGFADGLDPIEFFFHAASGKDALMDTTLRTPKSGYLYRRLVSVLRDLYVENDRTVRDTFGNIYQFIWGEDGIAVQKSEGGKLNVEKIFKEQ
ncbi:NEQ503 [Nanoarchaeum equitans Kin4-M]|uniref:DNA-directed RNA polymerase subunit Rpo1N n=1 Tax=Nanoarchaeum equitans (strain Kin4-M) TaxID=228908 RepID=Q74M69_NANEQ|nr:NEQ503 [Nanoarchaeum equitans Kin4-M]